MVYLINVNTTLYDLIQKIILTKYPTHVTLLCLYSVMPIQKQVKYPTHVTLLRLYKNTATIESISIYYFGGINPYCKYNCRQGRNQGGRRIRGLKPSFSQVKIEKKDKNFNF